MSSEQTWILRAAYSRRSNSSKRTVASRGIVLLRSLNLRAERFSKASIPSEQARIYSICPVKRKKASRMRDAAFRKKIRGTISRVLSWMIIYLGRMLPYGSSDLPEVLRRAACGPLLDLAPDGVYIDPGLLPAGR